MHVPHSTCTSPLSSPHSCAHQGSQSAPAWRARAASTTRHFIFLPAKDRDGTAQASRSVHTSTSATKFPRREVFFTHSLPPARAHTVTRTHTHTRLSLSLSTTTTAKTATTQMKHDLTHPRERRRHCLETSHVTCVLCVRRVSSTTDQLRNAPRTTCCHPRSDITAHAGLTRLSSLIVFGDPSSTMCCTMKGRRICPYSDARSCTLAQPPCPTCIPLW